ncbi:MAG: ABC transporter ATP-binding protein [Candidatus Aminicenantes bacterium]|nr:ABC transporter ATP-binding protein [Candidatus Aminicenantes bacterium]
MFNTKKEIISFFAPYWKKGIIPVSFLLVSTVISFLYPLFPKWAIDDIVLKKNAGNLAALAMLFAVLIVVQRLCSYLNEVTFFKFQKESILDIQRKLLDKVFHYPMEFFDKNHSGYLMGRIRGDVAGLNFIFSEGLVMIVMDMIKFIGTFVILLTLHVQLTLICMATLPFLVFKIVNSRSQIKSVNKKILQENALVEKELSDTFQGIEVLKSHSREAEGKERSAKALSGYQEIEVKRNVIFSKYRNLVTLIVNIGQVFLLYFGIREVLAARLTIGSYMAFSGYLVFLYAPIQNFSSLFLLFDFAKRSFKRLKELFNILPEDSGEFEIKNIHRIEMKNLDFSYNGNGELIKDVNLRIRKGDKVLIAGDSGSGKSTLMKLLLGLYRPQKGHILYNGRDIKEIDLKELRDRIGFISQDTFLFNKTIRENIVFGNNGISGEKVMRILEECKMKDKISSLDKGLDHLVCEKGNNFSGGEKQRISLARTLIKNPDVIILDEATANLDKKTEAEIEKIVFQKSKDKIIIKISHHQDDIEGWKVLHLS